MQCIKFERERTAWQPCLIADLDHDDRMTSTDDGQSHFRPERSASTGGRGIALTAGILALVTAMYGIVGTTYIGLTRVSISDFEFDGLAHGKRHATYAYAVLIVALVMLIYGFGAVQLLRHRPSGRRIVLVVTASTAVLAALGSIGTRGAFLVENIIGVLLTILIFIMTWANPTREWVDIRGESD